MFSWSSWPENAASALAFRGLGRLELFGATRKPSKRSLELLLLLTLKPEGWDPESLSEALYGEVAVHCVKSGISRLRRDLNLAISRAPYRLDEEIYADFIDLEARLSRGEFMKALALYNGPLAPESEAPRIVEHRIYLEELLKRTLLNQKDPDLLAELVRRFPDDLTVCEGVLNRLPEDHPARPFLEAQYQRIRSEYNLSP